MSIKREIIWAVIGNVVVSACQWGYILILAKYSTHANIGLYALAQAIVYPVSAFLNLQLRRLQVTDHSGIIGFAAYSVFAKFSGALALIFALVFGALTELSSADFLPVVALISGTKLIEGLSGVCYGVMQINSNMRAVAISSMLRSVCSIILFGIVIYNGYNLWIACLLMLIVWTSVYALYDKQVVIQYMTPSRGAVNFVHEIKAIVRIGLPLGIIILLNQVHLSIPRYVLKTFLTIEDVGIYAAIASLVTIGSVFMNSVGQAMLPKMALQYSHGRRREFYKLFFALFLFALSVGASAVAISYFFGNEILVLLYSRDFAQQQTLLVWVMLAGAAWYMSGSFGQALTAMRKFGSQAWLTGVVVITTFLVCWWAIPQTGTVGAAQGLLAGAIIKLLGQTSQLIYFVRIESGSLHER